MQHQSVDLVVGIEVEDYIAQGQDVGAAKVLGCPHWPILYRNLRLDRVQWLPFCLSENELFCNP